MAQSMDEAVKQAWQRFEQQVVLQIACLDDERTISFVVPDAAGGCPTGPAVFVEGQGDVRVLTLMLAHDGEVDTLDPMTLESLLLYGWQRPAAGEGRLRVAGPAASAADLAATVVSTLRSVISVVSPEFLDAEDPTDRDADDPTDHGGPEDDEPVEEVSDRDRLVELVRGSLRAHFGCDVEPDEDGDFGVRYGSAGIWVSIGSDGPLIAMHGPVVTEVRRKAQAAIEVNLLNRDLAGVTWYLQDDTVYAKCEINAWVYSGRVFRATLANLVGHIDRVDEDLALRVGGRTVFEEAS